MYCPKCGNEMVEVKGKLTCLAGDMTLTTICQRRLLEIFPKQNNRPYQVELGYDLLRWFCPSCGIPVKDYVCPECKKSMLPLHYMLVEHHFHKGATDALKKWQKQELKKSFNASRRSMVGHLVFFIYCNQRGIRSLGFMASGLVAICNNPFGRIIRFDW